MSISRTSHCRRNLAGNIQTFGPLVCFLRRHPDDSTYCVMYFRIVSQLYFSRTSRVVRATPEWPKVLWTKHSTPGMNVLGIARVRFCPLGAYQMTPLPPLRY